MNVDGNDLQDALAPLMGDPVEDAARVLEGLPTPPAVPPIAWVLLGAGLILGLFIGGWVYSSDESEPPVVTIPQPDKPDRIKPTPDEIERIMYYGLGEVTVFEPGSGPQTLHAGEYWVDMGARFETDRSIAGMLMGYEVQLRLGQSTNASVKLPTRMELHEGQVWVWSGAEKTAMVVVGTPHGLVDIVAGACDIEYRGGRLRVLCLSGEAVVQLSSGGSIRLTAGTMGVVNANDHEGPTKVTFLTSYTSWMTRLIVQQQDGGELKKLIGKMVLAYFGEEHRNEARKELRRIGSAAVPALVDRLVNTGGLPSDFAAETAQMIGAMAGPMTGDHLFGLLKNDDGEVRVGAYVGIYRITGEDNGTDAEYWRDEANRSGHAKTILAWWELVHN